MEEWEELLLLVIVKRSVSFQQLMLGKCSP